MVSAKRLLAVVLCLSGCHGAWRSSPKPPHPRCAVEEGAHPQLTLRLQHRMSDPFLFSSAEVRLDGTLVYLRICPREDDRCRRSVREGVEIFHGPLAPGRHKLAVRAKVRYCGRHYGRRICHLHAGWQRRRPSQPRTATDAPDRRQALSIRSYLFTLRSSHGFDARRDRPAQILIHTDEQGGITTPVEQRPTVRFVKRDPSPRCAGL